MPKIPKIPVEMRMLTFDLGDSDDKDGSQNSSEQNIARSNVSSAESFQKNLEKKRASIDSHDTVGHRVKNEHVFMPFKKEKLVEPTPRDGDSLAKEGATQNGGGHKEKAHSKTNENEKNYNSFFMTQVLTTWINESFFQPF